MKVHLEFLETYIALEITTEDTADFLNHQFTWPKPQPTTHVEAGIS